MISSCERVAVSHRLRAPLLRARTEMAWVRALVARGGEPARIISLVGDARETFVEHGVETIARSADAVHHNAERALAGPGLSHTGPTRRFVDREIHL